MFLNFLICKDFCYSFVLICHFWGNKNLRSITVTGSKTLLDTSLALCLYIQPRRLYNLLNSTYLCEFVMYWALFFNNSLVSLDFFSLKNSPTNFMIIARRLEDVLQMSSSRMNLINFLIFRRSLEKVLKTSITR